MSPSASPAFVLPRLKGLLEQNALLLVLDNLEHLLTDAGDWRDPLWGQLMAVLLGHQGLTRTILTSRLLPPVWHRTAAWASGYGASPSTH